jgi:hypothetical protein
MTPATGRQAQFSLQAAGGREHSFITARGTWRRSKFNLEIRNMMLCTNLIITASVWPSAFTPLRHNTTHTGAQNFPAAVSIVRLFARRVDEALLKTAGPSDSSTRPFEERPPCLQPL